MPTASGRRLARLFCPTPKQAYRSRHSWWVYRRATVDSMPTLIRIVAQALDRMASQRPAWQRVAIMTQPTLANTSDCMARATSDMPVLTVDASGKATKAVVVPHLTVADV